MIVAPSMTAPGGEPQTSPHAAARRRQEHPRPQLVVTSATSAGGRDVHGSASRQHSGCRGREIPRRPRVYQWCEPLRLLARDLQLDPDHVALAHEGGPTDAVRLEHAVQTLVASLRADRRGDTGVVRGPGCAPFRSLIQPCDARRISPSVGIAPVGSRLWSYRNRSMMISSTYAPLIFACRCAVPTIANPCLR